MLITYELLERLGFAADDIRYILEKDKLYGNKIASIAKEYMSHNGFSSRKAYIDGEAEQNFKRAESGLKQTFTLCNESENEYISNLLFWLHCIPFAHKCYIREGIEEEVFYDTMKDLVYKTEECKAHYGKCGVYVDWFLHIFDLRLFSLGRLEYISSFYRYNPYTFGDYILKKGDLVFDCHIPSSGKLTKDMCIDSFHRAYEFYKDFLPSSVLPVVCKSWLLYPPYIRSVFVPESNMTKFASLFDINEEVSTGREFKDCIRVFSKPFNGNIKGFPDDNSLRRNFIRYIESGNEFGVGVGIILYDGEKREIINKG